MVEIQRGHVLGLQTIKSGDLTYQGKPLKFECVNEEERVYQARAELTQEEIDAGNNTEHVFTVQFPIGEAVVNHSVAVPKLLENKNKNFKNMTDAEKFTYVNSLEHSTGRTNEPRQIADGSTATSTGVKANEAKKDKDKSAIEKENDDKAKEQQQQTDKPKQTTVEPASTKQDSGPKKL